MSSVLKRSKGYKNASHLQNVEAAKYLFVNKCIHNTFQSVQSVFPTFLFYKQRQVNVKFK